MMMLSASLPTGVPVLEQSGEPSPTARQDSPGNDFSALLFLVLAMPQLQVVPAGDASQPAQPDNAAVFGADGVLCSPALPSCSNPISPVQPGETNLPYASALSMEDQERLAPQLNNTVSVVAKQTSLPADQVQLMLAKLNEKPGAAKAAIEARFDETSLTPGGDAVAATLGRHLINLLGEGQDQAVGFKQDDAPPQIDQKQLDSLLRQNLTLEGGLSQGFTANLKVSSGPSNVQEQNTANLSVDDSGVETTFAAPDADLAVAHTPITRTSVAPQNSPFFLAHLAVEDGQVVRGPQSFRADPGLSEIDGNIEKAVVAPKASGAPDHNARLGFDDHGGNAFSGAYGGSRDHSAPFSDSMVIVPFTNTLNGEGPRSRDGQSSVSWPPVIEQVASGIVANIRQRKHEAVIALDPPELGSLKINLSLDGSKVQIRIIAEAHESRNLIEHHLPELKQALQVHRLDLIDARVEGGNWNGATGDLMHSFQRGSDNREQWDWSAGDLFRPLSESTETQRPDTTPPSTGRVSMWA